MSGFDDAFDFQVSYNSPRSTAVDPNAMSRGLQRVGLSCQLASPSACAQYANTVHTTLDEQLSQLGAKHIITAARASDPNAQDYKYQIVTDPARWMDKVNVILANAKWVRDNGIYAVDYEQTSSSNNETTVNALKDSFIQTGLKLGKFGGGHIDPDQLKAYLGDWISNLTEQNESTYKDQHDETLHIAFSDPNTGKTTRVGGLYFEFSLQISDYKSKKTTTHTRTWNMDQWTIVFDDGDVLNNVYNQVERHLGS
jgi:hypothetical protein